MFATLVLQTASQHKKSYSLPGIHYKDLFRSVTRCYASSVRKREMFFFSFYTNWGMISSLQFSMFFEGSGLKKIKRVFIFCLFRTSVGKIAHVGSKWGKGFNKLSAHPRLISPPEVWHCTCNEVFVQPGCTFADIEWI